jgi:hypothetical protein
MKNLKQCISLPEQVVESSQTSFWDTDQSLLSSGTNTPVTYSEPEQQTDGLKECQCGKETLGCSIHPNTKDEWIASMQDSLAKIFHQVAVDQVLAKTRDLDYTEKSYAFPIHFSLDTCSWKTWQTSLLEMTEQCSEQSLETLPNEATIASGVVYQLPKLVLDINVIDGGVWPTPTVSDTIGGIAHDTQHKNNLYFRVNKKGERWSVKLKDAVHYQEKKMWPTPMAHENRLGYQNRNNGMKGTQKSLTTEVIDDMGGRDKVIGQLNPQWVEWLMGWPLGHTELKR